MILFFCHCYFITVAFFSSYYLPSICFVFAFLQPPTPPFDVLLRIPSQLGCEFAAGFEINFQFIAYRSGAPAFVFFVPETCVFWYAGVWTSLVDFLAMGAINLLLFLFFAVRLVLVLWFAIFLVASGFATFGFGS